MLVAGVVTVVFRQFRQPVVLGYILAGFLIGPHTPPFSFIQDIQVVETLAELGVILLMFSLGLHFSLRHLASVGAVAVMGALLEFAVMISAGYAIGQAFGWSNMDSLFLGAILAISSTTIIIKALEDLGLTNERFAKITFGILIVEDIGAIVLLALLSGLATTGSLSVMDIMNTSTQLAIFLAVVLLAGLLIVPHLLRYLSRFKSNEMMLVALLGLCFGASLLALKFEYSVALGAFLIGAVIAESREGARASELVEPVRDMFSAVFFVAVGMLIQPALLLEYAVPIAVITVAVIVGKIFACSLGAFLGGTDARTAVRSGMSLAQIGEFSFIIAALGETLNVTSDFLYPIAVTVSALTTLSTPYLIRFSDPIESALVRLAPGFVRNSAHFYTRANPFTSMNKNEDNVVRKIFRRSLLQIGLNILLIGGIFIMATAAAPYLLVHMPTLPAWTGGGKTLLWGGAVLLALPLCVAVVRKLQAVCMILAEASVGDNYDDTRKYALRSLLTSILMAILCTLLVIAFLGMGYALLPPLPMLVALLAALGLFAYGMWGHFVRVYARAQIALNDVFDEADQAASERPLPTSLRQAEMCIVEIPEGSPARGKLIRELNVRALTGASIVGLERDGETTINPGPDEEMQAGDKLLLLGNSDQLTRGTSFFDPTAEPVKV